MEAQRTNAFKKFFQRRGKDKKNEPLKVASAMPPPEKKKSGLFTWSGKKDLTESAVESGSSDEKIETSNTPSPVTTTRPLFSRPTSPPTSPMDEKLPMSPSSASSAPGQLSPTSQRKFIAQRDGFCRRVNKYDGSVIHVEGVAAYELGNYLGGGVAGVVYEGHRLLPESEYPVRRPPVPTQPVAAAAANTLLDYVPMCSGAPARTIRVPRTLTREGSNLTAESFTGGRSVADGNSVALETVDNGGILIDDQDAPSRSKHMADALLAAEHSFMEETVAIKILNPVGFRALATEVTNTAVVARPGLPLPPDGQPMEEQHVWWLVNPSSRNLRTLQRYADENSVPQGVEVDRGSAERGLRISLIAAYQDPVTKKIRELPLQRCIEVWGHVPFEASDKEFRDVMQAIDKINQGHPPPPLPPGRVGTATSSMDSSNNNHSNWGLKKESSVLSKRT